MNTIKLIVFSSQLAWSIIAVSLIFAIISIIAQDWVSLGMMGGIAIMQLIQVALLSRELPEEILDELR